MPMGWRSGMGLSSGQAEARYLQINKTEGAGQLDFS